MYNNKQFLPTSQFSLVWSQIVSSFHTFNSNSVHSKSSHELTKLKTLSLSFLSPLPLSPPSLSLSQYPLSLSVYVFTTCCLLFKSAQWTAKSDDKDKTLLSTYPLVWRDVHLAGVVSYEASNVENREGEIRGKVFHIQPRPNLIGIVV